MALATLRLPSRATLVGALAVFAGHVVAALSDSFTVVTVSRVATALATGTFWAPWWPPPSPGPGRARGRWR